MGSRGPHSTADELGDSQVGRSGRQAAAANGSSGRQGEPAIELQLHVLAGVAAEGLFVRVWCWFAVESCS